MAAYTFPFFYNYSFLSGCDFGYLLFYQGPFSVQEVNSVKVMHHSAVKKFILSIIIFTLIVSLSAFTLFTFCIPSLYLPAFPLIILLFFLVNTIFFYTLHNYSNKRPVVVARSFLLGSGIKFFVYIIFLLCYILIRRDHAILFLFQFIFLYFIYTGFELAFLIRIMKNEVHDNKI